MKISDIQVTPLHPERWGNDLDVVNAARVSFHKEADWEYYNPEGLDGKVVSILSDQDKKLINYLAKHKHHSPFNHSFLSFRVKAPIFVARQLVKHKFLPWNEVSRRYVDEEPEFFWPKYWRAKANNVKQGSSEDEAPYMKKMQWDGSDSSDCYETAENLISMKLSQLVGWYQDIIDNGVAPEQARMILPQNMMTEWVWSGTLGAFLDMLKLRLDPHTQYESRIVAQEIAKHVREVFPVSFVANLGELFE